MTFNEYFDKVYGCWLGKCICGNIGAPFEGMKQKLSLRFDRSMVEDMLPNDDLDLQVLFLDVAEKYGADFTSAQLAESFFRNCPYAPGEYAYFKKNFQSGIYPPMSGSYNNSVYKDGMGCTIRSELWACLAPGQPEKAIGYCLRDGTLDHCGDGLYGEMFMTALQSLAFEESDVFVLAERAKAYIPGTSRLRRLIDEVTEWVRSGYAYDEIRERIIGEYGSAEATSVFENVGFILLNLFLGEEDILEAALRTCECGFDTDCTCATLGAIKGIIAGGKRLNERYDFSEVVYKLGVTAKPRSGLVADLSEEIAELGAYLNGIGGGKGKYHIGPFEPPEELEFSVDYDGAPSIAFGETKRVVLRIDNRSVLPTELVFEYSAPLKLSLQRAEIGSGESELEIFASVDKDADLLPLSNVVTVHYGKEKVFRFGFAGTRRYRVYGPFWQNNVEVPDLKAKESYWNYFPAESESEQMDKIRFYHTNCLPRDIEPEEGICEKNFLCTADNAEDVVALDSHIGFDGQAYYFFKYRFQSDRALKLGLQMGYNVPVQLYLNGEKLISNEEFTRYTPENSHRFGVTVKEGSNEIIVKIRKSGDGARFSFDFLEGGACSNHVTDFKIKNSKE